MRKKMVLMPQTIGPFKGFFAKCIAKLVLQNAYKAYSRDEAGIAETNLLIKNSHHYKSIQFCFDVGFILDPIRPVQDEMAYLEKACLAYQHVFGVNVSGLLYMGGYNRKNMFFLKTDYRSIILEIIDYALSMENTVVLLVPHVFGSYAESDTTAIEKVYAETSNRYPNKVFKVSGLYNQNEIKYIIGRCHVFVGSRMHACIAALSQGIPAVSIAYSKKFIGVLKSIGMESFCVDPRVQDSREILACIRKIFKERNEIRMDLQKRMPHITETVLNLFVNN